MIASPSNTPATADAQALDRLREMAVNGRLAEAELELHAWCRRGGPPAARVLLAALLARRDDFAAAREVLGQPQRTQPQAMDPAQAKLAVAVLLRSGLDDEARRLSAWLYHLHGHDPDVAQWVTLMDVPGLTELPAVPDATVERLTDELAADPEVVPSLVYATKHAPRTKPISLLRAAIARATARFEGEPVMEQLTQALAELAMLAGDEDDARRWAHRGLRINPFNAVLAMLLGQLEDDEAVGPPAAETLKRVALKFPHYPDVQAAYARRLEIDRLKAA
ncbi:MAG: hypothetical protein AAFX76_06700 [Planctomycetota bacterium]